MTAPRCLHRRRPRRRAGHIPSFLLAYPELIHFLLVTGLLPVLADTCSLAFKAVLTQFSTLSSTLSALFRSMTTLDESSNLIDTLPPFFNPSLSLRRDGSTILPCWSTTTVLSPSSSSIKITIW